MEIKHLVNFHWHFGALLCQFCIKNHSVSPRRRNNLQYQEETTDPTKTGRGGGGEAEMRTWTKTFLGCFWWVTDIKELLATAAIEQNPKMASLWQILVHTTYLLLWWHPQRAQGKVSQGGIQDFWLIFCIILFYYRENLEEKTRQSNARSFSTLYHSCIFCSYPATYL